MWAMMQKFRTSACFVVTAIRVSRENTHVAVVLAIGGLVTVAGVVLLLNLFGAGDYVIRRVTSKYLGELPPGFAASRRGFRIYATLVIAIGVVCLGLGLTSTLLPIAAGLIVVGAGGLGVASVVAIAGEGETARRSKKTPPPASPGPLEKTP